MQSDRTKIWELGVKRNGFLGNNKLNGKLNVSHLLVPFLDQGLYQMLYLSFSVAISNSSR